MKITCDFCNEFISDTDETCPHCGAKNEHYKRMSHETPKTIEELQQWYTAHNLPPKEVTRFFIGEDYRAPRAFGIYRDGDRFIVYKNKDDGSRAIRYDGGDEAYAVNELYLKLKERIAEQKANNGKGPQARRRKRKFFNKTNLISVISFIVIFMIAIVIAILEPNRGYYNYQGDQYYYLDDYGWYLYDTTSNDWVSTSVDRELEKNYSDYYQSTYYDSDYDTSDFEDTSYYYNWQISESESGDWDSDSSWSSGDSWDSGGGDWSSDW